MNPPLLLIGYGNPGRLDDGLGPAFAAAVEGMGLEGVTVDADYQLTVEHAAAVAGHGLVLFADAAVRGPAPFALYPVAPTDEGAGFSTHSVSSGAVMALARDLFGAAPPAWAIGLRGYDFDGFGERLGERASAHLKAALRALTPALRAATLSEAVRALEPWMNRTGPTEERPCATAST